MSHACTPILVGMTFPVSEIPLLSKTAKFPFRGMDYSPWSSKNLINRNRLKKFMQVGIDEMCMCTKFGGRGLCFWRFWSFFLVNFCLENKRDDFIDYYFCIRVQLLLVVIIMM